MPIARKTSHYFNKFIIKNNNGVFIIKVKIISKLQFNIINVKIKSYFDIRL
jgi:hypothetical protein